MIAMTRIEETRLPGVGVRHDFTTRAGARIGVVNHRTGRRELFIYAADDPDAASSVVRLDDEEGHVLADLLGGTTVAAQVHEVQQEVEGLTIDWLKVERTSTAVGRPIADAAARHDTGAFIVAVLRGGETIPAPGGTFVLEAGDTAVVISTAEGIGNLAAILRGS
jgi:TrkA domain protein